ncbi:NAD(P)-binding protein [Pleurotus eryngii]|uniref:NAD(P)-binding protein n=1 Tax=Pleurotus eryngii TaxID=5323 RepID=A0A9P6DFC1_PLEER|nr:NAD(P)-binding protein [Pleurotus eryngii]
MSTRTPTIADSKCILITGATSGIDLPGKPQVIAVGRRQGRLDELATQCLEAINLDVQESPQELKSDLDVIVARHPDLDTVVLNAGVQHQFDFAEPASVDFNKIAEELNINYTSIVATVVALMSQFQKSVAQGRDCFFIGISSGLSMVPAAWVPNYSASKAAIHSFLMAFRAQLVDSKIHVIEIMPPLVESELHDRLLKGDGDVPVGIPAEVFQKFEAGKSQMAVYPMKNHKAGKSY